MNKIWFIRFLLVMVILIPMSCQESLQTNPGCVEAPPLLVDGRDIALWSNFDSLRSKSFTPIRDITEYGDIDADLHEEDMDERGIFNRIRYLIEDGHLAGIVIDRFGGLASAVEVDSVVSICIDHFGETYQSYTQSPSQSTIDSHSVHGLRGTRLYTSATQYQWHIDSCAFVSLIVTRFDYPERYSMRLHISGVYREK